MTAHDDTNGVVGIDDPRLTAYALGELSASEMTEMAATVAADPNLQAEVAAIRAFGATLADELAAEPAPELGAAARAAIVTAGDHPPANDDDTPAVLTRRWYAAPRFLVAAGLFVAAGAAAAIALSSGGDGTTPADAPDMVLSERVQPETPESAQPDGEVAATSAAATETGEASSTPGAGTKSTGGAEVAGTETAGTRTQQPTTAHTSTGVPPARPVEVSENKVKADVPPRVATSRDNHEPRVPTSQPVHADGAPRPDANRNLAADEPEAEDMEMDAFDRGKRAASAARPYGGSSRGLGHLAKNRKARRGTLADGDVDGSAVVGLSGTGGGGSGDMGGLSALSGALSGPVAAVDDGDSVAGALDNGVAGEAALGRSGAMSLPMLRGAGGVVIDSLAVPNGTVVTVQMPDGRLVRSYVAPNVAYDPNPYWFDPHTRRWYYDYEYYYYGQAPQGGGGETYAPIYESPFKRADSEPLSTFSTDVDTASYANVRRFIEKRQRPPRDAVRIEELINAFTYDTPRPTDGEPLTVQTEVAGCPWAPTHRLVRVAIAAREVNRAQRPAGNLVFLVDTSGSMGNSKKLPLLKRALRELVKELDERDTVSIVTYAGHAGVALKPTNGSEKAKILRAVARLHAAGMTNGSAGLTKAYELAREHYIAGGTNRVLLATDGDFNAGMTSRYALVQQVAAAASENIYLTVLGLGTGNLDDDRLEAISNRGNGTYAYIDSDREARRVLVDQLTKTLVTVAKDVKLQVEWNPAHVLAYRLIGYENRGMANRDFDNDRKDAGDLGAGATVTALYEVVPAGETPTPKPPRHLKYQQPPEEEEPLFTGPPAPADISAEMMTVRVRYKAPEGSESETLEAALVDDGTTLAGASDDFRWAAAIAGFGMMMRRSYYRGNAFWGQIHSLALGAVADDPNGERTELLRLVTKAARLYGWR